MIPPAHPTPIAARSDGLTAAPQCPRLARTDDATRATNPQRFEPQPGASGRDEEDAERWDGMS
jgi:hypothetical protein